MADNLNLTTKHETPDNWPDFARQVAEDWGKNSLGVAEDSTFYVVWFCFILGGWKALVSSTNADGRYYEVTKDKEKGKIYVDTYIKTHNVELDVV